MGRAKGDGEGEEEAGGTSVQVTQDITTGLKDEGTRSFEGGVGF